MSDSELLDRAFPFGDDEPDVLMGLPDQTEGLATEFLSILSDTDLEIVQWYADQGIRPTTISLEYYSVNLITGYHMVDPHRLSKLGLKEAQKEMKRISRYAQLFVESAYFFPVISVFGRKELDEDGSYYDINIRAWDCLNGGKPYERVWQRLDVEDHAMPILLRASNFLEDPESEPDLRSLVEDLIKNKITD